MHRRSRPVYSPSRSSLRGFHSLTAPKPPGPSPVSMSLSLKVKLAGLRRTSPVVPRDGVDLALRLKYISRRWVPLKPRVSRLRVPFDRIYLPPEHAETVAATKWRKRLGASTNARRAFCGCLGLLLK